MAEVETRERIFEPSRDTRGRAYIKSMEQYR
jgi:hypothetical protein